MSPIAIWERMNPDHLVMKPDREFVSGKNALIDLITGVVQQSSKPDCHLRPVDANVLVARTECACPLPRPVVHLLVQIADESFVEEVPALLPEHPAFALQDVGSSQALRSS